MYYTNKLFKLAARLNKKSEDLSSSAFDRPFVYLATVLDPTNLVERPAQLAAIPIHDVIVRAYDAYRNIQDLSENNPTSPALTQQYVYLKKMKPFIDNLKANFNSAVPLPEYLEKRDKLVETIDSFSKASELIGRLLDKVYDKATNKDALDNRESIL